MHYPLITHATMLLTDGHISLALNDIDTDVHTVAGGHGKVTSFSGTIRGQHFSLKPPDSGPPGNPWNGWKYGLKQISVRGETCGGSGRYSYWPNSYGTNCAPRVFPWQGAVKAVMLECETDDGDVYYGE